MIKFLIRHFVKDSDNTNDTHVREQYSVLGGILSVICNLFLFALKISIGLFIGSIAIVSDALNNLSDTGSSLISIIGAKFSNKKPDREHPFGHGRFEYISSLIVSFIILLVGFELFKAAALKIVHSESITLNPAMIIILTLSVLVKVWMYSYNKYLGRQINSGILTAAARDSLNDVISTLVLIAAAILSEFVHLPWLDGAAGVVVAVIIMRSGIEIAHDTIGMLLGSPPSRETVEKITSIISSGDNIVGVHDLIVHDYGPGRIMASAHAEVPDNSDIIKIHETRDSLERQIETQMGIHMVIHMDPISVNCERTNQIKSMVLSILKELNPELNIHDFRMTDGENRLNLIFDLEVPAGLKDGDKLPNEIEKRLKKMDSRICCVINTDTVYTTASDK